MIPTGGGSFYDTGDVAARFLIHRHDPATSPNLVMEDPALWSTLGDPSGVDVLDLGCGDGNFGTQLIAAGARSYLGVDGSSAMIERATAAAGPGVAFEHQTIEAFEPGRRQFDVVTARMSLHYLAAPSPVLAMARSALRPGGRLILSVVHPVITSHDNSPLTLRTSWTVDRYFDEGPRDRSWFGSGVTWHHRTIETWVCLVIDAGFTIDRLSECEPDPSRLIDAEAELARRRRVPLMLLLAGTAL